MEILYKKTEQAERQLAFSDIRWLSADEYSIFSTHLALCGQKPLPESVWAEIYEEGTIYCGLFVEERMVGRACVEKYSQNAWEVADVRVAKPYRNRGYAYRLGHFVLSYILSQGKTATIRTEGDNFAMQKVIEKLGFTKCEPDGKSDCQNRGRN